MSADPDLTTLASLLADRSRCTILWQLLDGRSWTAGELAKSAKITNSTASSHLFKLLRAGWIAVVQNGRHRYFRLAGVEIADLLERLASFAPATEQLTPGERRASLRMRNCRLCYDHVAGHVGVSILRCLLSKGHMPSFDGPQDLTPSGVEWLRQIGLPVDETLGKPCMDWTERRLHIGGPLGRSLAHSLMTAHWVKRSARDRALWITPHGEAALRTHFGINLLPVDSVAAALPRQ